MYRRKFLLLSRSYNHAFSTLPEDNTCEREWMILLRKTSNFWRGGVSNESAIFTRLLLTELTGLNGNFALIGIPRYFSYSLIPNEEITLFSRRKGFIWKGRIVAYVVIFRLLSNNLRLWYLVTDINSVAVARLNNICDRPPPRLTPVVGETVKSWYS